MSQSRNDKPTAPPPPSDAMRRQLLDKAQELRAHAQRILTTAGDLVLIAESLSGGSVQ